MYLKVAKMRLCISDSFFVECCASLGNFTTVSIKIVSVSHISAVNFIVGCKVHLFEESYDVWFTYVPF